MGITSRDSQYPSGDNKYLVGVSVRGGQGHVGLDDGGGVGQRSDGLDDGSRVGQRRVVGRGMVGRGVVGGIGSGVGGGVRSSVGRSHQGGGSGSQHGKGHQLNEGEHIRTRTRNLAVALDGALGGRR